MSRPMERMLQLLEDIRDNLATTTGEGTSSVQIEDLASKPEPKITTKHYVGRALTAQDVDEALRIHAYAKTQAAALAMNQWQLTVNQLAGRTS